MPDLKSSIKNYLDFNKRIEIKNIIKNEVIKSDFIIARLPSSNGNLAVKFAKKYNKPYLIEVVGCSWDSLWNYSVRGKLIALPSYLSMKRSVKDAPYVIYVTNKFLQHRYPTNGKHTNCSNVTLTDFSDNILQVRLEKISKIDEQEKIVIGTIGAVNVRYKGQGYVIKALAELKRLGIKNYEYQLVGGGNQAYLMFIARKYGVSDQVKYLGSMPHNEVLRWLENIDVYIQPSKTEGLPRALIEAMSKACPSIGSNVGGIPELLDESMIFDINKTNKLISLLENINKEKLKIEANRNFREAMKYDKKVIETRRNRFLRDSINEK